MGPYGLAFLSPVSWSEMLGWAVLPGQPETPEVRSFDLSASRRCFSPGETKQPETPAMRSFDLSASRRCFGPGEKEFEERRPWRGG